MRHPLTTEHKEYLKKLRIPEPHPDYLEISPEEYEREKANWKRSLPSASDDAIHARVLGHFADKWHAKNKDSASRFPQVQKEIEGRIDTTKEEIKRSHFERRMFDIAILFVLMILLILFILRAHV